MMEVKNLSVSFSVQGRKLQAVRDISFSVAEGEAVGIIGESGSGKSAAVQAIMRLVPSAQVEGSVLFQGEELMRKSEKELQQIRGKKIGMVFQDPLSSLNPTMRILDQITEGILHHKLASKNEARAEARTLLQLVGVPDPDLRLRQYPHELSGGLRQRVLIAIALSCRPQLLIADEPTSALDVTVSAQILDLLQSVQRKLRTSLLLITHDLGVVSRCCDRVLVLYAGKIVEQGSVESVLKNPRHPYTQMLLRAVPRLAKPIEEGLRPIEGSLPNLLSPPQGCPFAPRCPHASSECAKMPPMEDSFACWRRS